MGKNYLQAKRINNSNLFELFIPGNIDKLKIPKDDTLELLQAIKENIYIEKISFDYQAALDDDFILKFFEHLRTENSLKTLSLNNCNNIGTKGIEAISEHLKEDNMLEELNLSVNGFTDKSAKTFFSAVKENKSLKSLGIENLVLLKIPELVHLIADVVKTNSNLISLRMMTILSYLSDSDLAVITESFKNNFTLLSIGDLEFDPESDDPFISQFLMDSRYSKILEYLERNRSLLTKSPVSQANTKALITTQKVTVPSLLNISFFSVNHYLKEKNIDSSLLASIPSDLKTALDLSENEVKFN